MLIITKKQPIRLLLFSIQFLFNVGPQPPGNLTAHENDHLPLLPSGPDGIRKFPLRKTKAPRSDLKKEFLILNFNGGELGIRTLGTVSRTHAFQACSFNRSDNSPLALKQCRSSTVILHLQRYIGYHFFSFMSTIFIKILTDRKIPSPYL